MNEAPTQKITEPLKARLTKDEFLSRVAVKTKTISLPELGGEIVVRSITAKDRDEIMAACTDRRTGATKEHIMNALTIVKGLVEPALTASEVEALVNSDFALTLRISNFIWTMSGGVEAIKND